MLFHFLLGVPKLYVALASGFKSEVIPAVILIVSVASSPICTLPEIVISPSATKLPVISMLPVTAKLLCISTLPEPCGTMSISALDTVLEITFVSNLKSSTSNVFNAVTLSDPTVDKFKSPDTESIVFPLIRTLPTYAVPVVIKSVDLVVPLTSKSY